MRSIGIPMKAMKAETVTEMKQCLTGRDAKVVMEKYVQHVPAMLEFAHAEEEDIAEELAADDGPPPRTAADDEAFTWAGSGRGGEEESGSEETDGEQSDTEDELSEELKDARSWDAFAGFVYACRSFDGCDDPTYREERAVEAFNAARKVMQEYNRLFPGFLSSVPHVALCVVPRQMIEHGDPNRRSTDHSESFGAAVKDTVHRRCLRRRKETESKLHKRRKASATGKRQWTQRPLSVSRVMQTFRDTAVRALIMLDEGSEEFLQRRHVVTMTTGFATAGDREVKEREAYPSLFERMSEGRDLA